MEPPGLLSSTTGADQGESDGSINLQHLTQMSLYDGDHMDQHAPSFSYAAIGLGCQRPFMCLAIQLLLPLFSTIPLMSGFWNWLLFLNCVLTSFSSLSLYFCH